MTNSMYDDIQQMVMAWSMQNKYFVLVCYEDRYDYYM